MRGHVVDITAKLSSETATILAQWIGASNVIRNQKIRENEAAYRAFIDGIGEQPTIDQSASHIHKIDGFGFLKTVPPQVRRNAAPRRPTARISRHFIAASAGTKTTRTPMQAG